MSLVRMSSWPLLALLLAAGCAGNKPAEDPAAADRAALVAAASGKAQVDPEEQQRKALQARLQAGMESLKARDPERARRHISRALEIAPNSADGNNAMALLYGYEGDDKREEIYFRRAVRGEGNTSQARNNYAAFLYRQQRYREAAEQLEKAVDDTSYDQRGVAFLNLGRCYVNLGDLTKAESALQRSLRLESQRADTMLELADVLVRQQRYAEAETYLSMFQTRMRNNSRSLWIGIRLAAARGEVDKIASYEFQLEKLYKDSTEYLAWRAWKKGGNAPSARHQ